MGPGWVSTEAGTITSSVGEQSLIGRWGPSLIACHQDHIRQPLKYHQTAFAFYRNFGRQTLIGFVRVDRPIQNEG